MLNVTLFEYSLNIIILKFNKFKCVYCYKDHACNYKRYGFNQIRIVSQYKIGY